MVRGSIIAAVPVTALFTLFDFVIHNPLQPDTWSNLALLEMVGGHFSRIEYATGGSMPGTLVSEFSHIARDYVKEAQRRTGAPVGNPHALFVTPGTAAPVATGLTADSCAKGEAPLGDEDVSISFLGSLAISLL